MVKINCPIIVIILLLIACTETSSQSIDMQVTNILSIGNDGGTSDFCADFSLTKVEVQYYFDHAKLASTKTIHDDYAFLPCYVLGTGIVNATQCQWQIWAGGTSRIRCSDKVTLMACDDCLPVPQ